MGRDQSACIRLAAPMCVGKPTVCMQQRVSGLPATPLCVSLAMVHWEKQVAEALWSLLRFETSVSCSVGTAPGTQFGK